MNKLINSLKDFKKTTIWKSIIEYLFYPFFNLIWSYLINFKAKILYFLWNLKKKNYFDFSDNDKLIISDNNYFKEIANKILKETDYLKEDAKQKLFDLNYSEKLRKKNDANGELPYRISLYDGLSPELQKEIVTFASSDKMITTACKYMKIFPILTRVQVSLNIPREGSKPRSAILWHKDGFGFKNLDFFMNVSEVDENNGPFYCLEKKIKAGIFKSFDYLMTRTGERNKVTLENFDKQFKDTGLIQLKGKSGTGIFLDSFSVFHRGGFCKLKDRIMLRFCYQSHDAFCENFLTNSDEFMYDKSITKNNTKDIFKSFIFFKKPSTFMKLLSKKLLKFYYLIEFKYKL
jgi:hypothetical protein